MAIFPTPIMLLLTLTLVPLVSQAGQPLDLQLMNINPYYNISYPWILLSRRFFMAWPNTVTDEPVYQLIRSRKRYVRLVFEYLMFDGTFDYLMLEDINRKPKDITFRHGDSRPVYQSAASYVTLFYNGLVRKDPTSLTRLIPGFKLIYWDTNQEEELWEPRPWTRCVFPNPTRMGGQLKLKPHAFVIGWNLRMQLNTNYIYDCNWYFTPPRFLSLAKAYIHVMHIGRKNLVEIFDGYNSDGKHLKRYYNEMYPAFIPNQPGYNISFETFSSRTLFIRLVALPQLVHVNFVYGTHWILPPEKMLPEHDYNTTTGDCIAITIKEKFKVFDLAKCLDSDWCIPDSNVCDGVPNCPGGIDEKGCLPRTATIQTTIAGGHQNQSSYYFYKLTWMMILVLPCILFSFCNTPDRCRKIQSPPSVDQDDDLQQREVSIAVRYARMREQMFRRAREHNIRSAFPVPVAQSVTNLSRDTVSGVHVQIAVEPENGLALCDPSDSISDIDLHGPPLYQEAMESSGLLVHGMGDSLSSSSNGPDQQPPSYQTVVAPPSYETLDPCSDSHGAIDLDSLPPPYETVAHIKSTSVNWKMEQESAV